jgi:hypothetical protein
MANPNIVSVATIEGGNLGFNLTATTTTTLVTVSSNYIMKINRISCANVDGQCCSRFNFICYKMGNYTPTGITNFDVSGTFHLAKTISVPADATLVISDTPIYLVEGDILKGGANAASDLDLFISYEVLID